MAEITVLTETGRPKGSRAARRLRGEGKVPGIVYGQGADPVTVAVEWKPFRAAITTEAGLNALLNLQIDGDTRLAIVKDLQRHPVNGNVLHVDFLLINRDEVISVDIPIILEGEALEVQREEGLVEHVLNNLTVNAKPADIPNELTVDISGMHMGDTIRVGDLPLPSGVTTDVEAEEAVVITSIASPIEEPEAEAEEGEEGEAGAEGAEGVEGAEGEAGGEGGGASDSSGGDSEG